MEDIFDILRRHGIGLGTDTYRVIESLSHRQLLKLDEDLYASGKPLELQTRGATVAGFDFWPNSEISASAGACVEALCRRARLERLIRFAAMWSDSVHIPTYFGMSSAQPDLNAAQGWMIGSIDALLAAEPCINAGIIKIAAGAYHVCPSCQTEIEPEMDRLKSLLEEAEASIKRSYGAQIDARFETENGEGYSIVITGPKDLIPHGSSYLWWPPGDLPTWIPQNIRNQALSGRDVSCSIPLRGRARAGVLDRVLHPIIEDVVSQRLSCRLAGTKYLTDRPVDSILLNAINENERFAGWNKVLAQYLHWETPVLAEVPVDELLTLRRDDYEAFAVYRDTMKRVITDHVADRAAVTEREASDIYEDCVLPELNRMNQKLNSVRTKLSNKLRRDVAIAGSTMVFGLSSGFLAPELALSAAMATPFLANAAKNLLERKDASEELTGESFYFLWKAASRRRRT